MRDHGGGAGLRGLKPAALSVCALGLLAAGVVGAPPPAPPAAPHAVEPAPVVAAAPGELVTVQHGELPIILSAPHGGMVRVPGSTDRTRGTSVHDLLTAQVALLTAQRLTEKLGAKPGFVIAQFSRKDADANRPVEDGTENPAAAAQHRAYHRALRGLVDDARARNPAAILVDIHAQSRFPGVLVRGTRNGRTVSALVGRRGPAAISGPDSIFGRLKRAGYTVMPDIDPDRPEDNTEPERHFDGGYIVAAYGSHTPGGIDAIQIELGGMRSDRIMEMARDLADAIAAFYLAHVQPQPADAPAKPADPEVPDDVPARVPSRP